MSPDEQCQRQASRQHMVITRAEALDRGLHPRALARRISSGAWQRLFPGIYFIGYGRPAWEAWVMSACLWGGERAAASHVTAATLFGFEIPRSDVIHISLPLRRNSIDGLKTHFDPTRAGARKVWVGPIPTTTIERTVLDLCAGSERSAASDLVARVIRMGKTDIGRLHRFLGSLSSSPPGCRTLRWVLRHRFGGGVTDSAAEDLFAVMARRELPGVVHHHVVRHAGRHVAGLDFAFLPEKLDVEIDGDQFHADAASVQRDKERDAELGELGWYVVRFTYWQLVERPDRVVSVVKRILEQRRNQLAV